MLNVTEFTEKANWKNEAKWSAIVFCVLLLIWWVWPESPAPVGETKIAEVAKEVKDEPKAEIKPAKVQAYKPKVKSKLGLPQEVQNDPHAHVISASKIRADGYDHTPIVVMNEQTGEVTTYDRRDPLPWLAINPSGAAGIYYGLKNGQQTARLQVRQNLLQIKAVHIGGLASVDQPIGGIGQTDWFVGLGAEYRW